MPTTEEVITPGKSQTRTRSKRADASRQFFWNMLGLLTCLVAPLLAVLADTDGLFVRAVQLGIVELTGSWLLLTLGQAVVFAMAFAKLRPARESGAPRLGRRSLGFWLSIVSLVSCVLCLLILSSVAAERGLASSGLVAWLGIVAFAIPLPCAIVALAAYGAILWKRRDMYFVQLTFLAAVVILLQTVWYLYFLTDGF